MTTALELVQFNLYNPIWYLTSAVVLFYFVFYVSNRTKSQNIIAISSLAFFVINALIVIILTLFYYKDLPDGAQGMYAGFVLSFVSYFAVGVCFQKLVSANYSLVLALVLVLMIAPILAVTDYSTLSIPFREIFEKTGINYLLFGDMIALFCFMLIGSSLLKDRNFCAIFIFFMLISVVLFINGSRTSFAVFVFCFLFCYAVSQGFSIRFFIYLTSLFVLSAMIYLFVSSAGLDTSQFEKSRMLSILSSGSNDGSLVNRDLILEGGLRRISEHFIEGDIGGQVAHPYGGSPLGSYMHNILSYWEQFGLIGFASFLIAWLALGYSLLQAFIIEGNRNVRLSVSAMFLYSIISMLFSRAFVHTVFMFVWSYLYLYICATRVKKHE